MIERFIPSECFSPVTMDNILHYEHMFKAMPVTPSDYSFVNIFGWAEYYGLEWKFSHDLIWLRQTKPQILSWAPVGAWHDIDWTEPSIKRVLKANGPVFDRVPEQLAILWHSSHSDNVELQESRGHWDYIYEAKDLAELPGNRYHRKRNHFNQFKKLYENYVYKPITSKHLPAVLAMQAQWYQWYECKNSPSLAAENYAIQRVLSHWNHFSGLSGGIIWVANEIIAYCVSEALNSEETVIHFEKACFDYRGAYQAINCFHAQDIVKNHTFINREQDMDDDGIRHAKKSYLPKSFLKKCRAIIK